MGFTVLPDYEPLLHPTNPIAIAWEQVTPTPKKASRGNTYILVFHFLSNTEHHYNVIHYRI